MTTKGKATAPQTRQAKTKANATPPAGDDKGDRVPADIDEFRREMARRMLSFTPAWRRCDQRVCRRARRCAGPDLACQRRADRPPLTPEEEARAGASMYRALKRRAAELGLDEQD